ncbi:MAG: hypothetical protein WKF90_02315 [Pyrinomonadaceae bacterium]
MSELTQDFPPIVVKKLTGAEHFHNETEQTDETIGDFWRWFGSDLTNNVIRGAVAEFIVATALNIADGVRDVWSPFDLLTRENIKIEVKSAAYLQTWYQKAYSAISFDIGQTRAYDSITNQSETEVKRQADIYVFCLLHFKDKTNLNPMNLDQWEFYILPTLVLNEKHLNQRKIGLSSLLKLNPQKVKYEEIADCIKNLSGLKS